MTATFDEKSVTPTGVPTMRAYVQAGYGLADSFELRDVPKPRPGPEQVLLGVHASSINAMEWHLSQGIPYMLRAQMGFTKPKTPTLGADVAGVVEAVGSAVSGFQPSDEVWGDIEAGGYAEYAVVESHKLVSKPSNLTFEQVAAAPVAGLTALQGLRDVGKIRPGQRVLINGASGGVGTFAISVAKAMGASVTAVCRTDYVDQALGLGADRVVDYTKEDFTEIGETFDVMFDGPGNRSWSECKKILSPTATYMMFGGPKGRLLGPIPRMISVKLATAFGKRRFKIFVAKMIQDDLSYLGSLMESGEVVPMIERVYDFEDLPAAMSRFNERHLKGKLVISM